MQAVRSLRRGEPSETFALWQTRLVLEMCESRTLQGRVREGGQGGGALLSSEFLPVMKNTADGTLDHWLAGGCGFVVPHAHSKCLCGGG